MESADFDDLKRQPFFKSPVFWSASFAGALVAAFFSDWRGLLTGPLFGFLFWSCAPTRPFGSMRVKFPQEFRNKEKSIQEIAEKPIKDKLGPVAYKAWKADQKSEMSWYTDKKWIDLLNEPEVEEDDNLKYAIYIMAGMTAIKLENYERGIEYLKKARLIKPDDMIACVRLAQAFERLGAAFDAIGAYESALKDKSATPIFRRFISSQIAWIKREGPRKKPPMSGLKHLGLSGR